MSKKNNAKPVDRAEPTIKKAMVTDLQKVDVAKATTASMAKSPLWAGAPDVQNAAAGWIQSAEAISENAKLVADLRNQLGAAEAKQRTLRRNFGVCKQLVLSTVSLVCAGSADAVKGFSFEVVTRVPASPLAAVEGIATSPGAETGETIATWSLGLARHGFLVQHATDPADPATYAMPIPCTKCKFTLAGATPPGGSVHLRIAAIDPNAPMGLSPWSIWVAATVK